MKTCLRVLLLVAATVLLASLVPPAPADDKPEGVLKDLLDKLNDPKADREKVRLELFAYQRTAAGTPQGILAAEAIKKLTSPADKLAAGKIPAEERFAWQPKELVAVIGEHRGRHWAGA